MRAFCMACEQEVTRPENRLGPTIVSVPDEYLDFTQTTSAVKEKPCSDCGNHADGEGSTACDACDPNHTMWQPTCDSSNGKE